MGRWTLHLSVGLGLLAVLLTCCYAEGEEVLSHNESFCFFVLANCILNSPFNFRDFFLNVWHLLF